MPDPDSDTVNTGAEILRKEKCQFVIGIGGGSAIDAAKAIAATATHDGSVLEYVRGGNRELTDHTLPIVAIPTTSGTGSQVGQIAVISDSKIHQKKA